MFCGQGDVWVEYSNSQLMPEKEQKNLDCVLEVLFKFIFPNLPELRPQNIKSQQQISFWFNFCDPDAAKFIRGQNFEVDSLT